MAKSRTRKPSFDDPAPPDGPDGQTGWVYRSTPAGRTRQPAGRRRTGGSDVPPPPAALPPAAAGPAPVPALVPAAPARGLLESGVDLLSIPFAFALVLVLVPLTWFKGHAPGSTH